MIPVTVLLSLNTIPKNSNRKSKTQKKNGNSNINKAPKFNNNQPKNMHMSGLSNHTHCQKHKNISHTHIHILKSIYTNTYRIAIVVSCSSPITFKKTNSSKSPNQNQIYLNDQMKMKPDETPMNSYNKSILKANLSQMKTIHHDST